MAENTLNPTRIIVIDDDYDIRINTAELISTRFNQVDEYESPSAVEAEIIKGGNVVILTDLRMPNDDGLEFAKRVYKIDPEIPVILMTGYGDVSIAVDALKHGVYDFIEKPFEADHLLEAINRAVDKRRLTLSVEQLEKQRLNENSIDSQLIGESHPMRRLKRDILDFAPMDIPVMIHGETGAGKELAALCLHEYSRRKDGNFVALNCAAIPEQLAESELFGFVKGAFTDAKQARTGKLEYANGGTLFLDEIESLSLNIQAKLLRAISDQKVIPVGSNKSIPINCRIISATKEDLRNNANFRQDLFFRLQVAEVKIPPLRDRSDDIVHLFEVFTIKHCKQLSTQYRSITPYARERILNYDWPGNVRELINVTTRYAIKNCSDIDYALESDDRVIDQSQESLPLKQLVEDYEASVIKLKLHEHKGKVSKVLEELSIEHRTFNQKLNKYGIQTSDYK
ncbi:sigma-54-dependent transcriptional regulator [Sessilibacter corallicola]|uniref:sigma-54-dependent transcriptional regulator n=1 Tax=Sessilibacter corallicola TaxID=2904075 RepID=UPI001E481CED|nr:sigma-54 dependent transcriptional regulator [Sessilibacter corallicola]MCE2028414.1 sigma-54 dependent transcriptional regulator [Sessilibacter corallicola]